MMENCMESARTLREGLERTGRFTIISKEQGVPLVAFTFKAKDETPLAFKLSAELRRFGWIVPAYTMPADAEHVAVLRVVVREDFSRSLAERLVSDVRKILRELDARATHAVRVATATAEQSGDGVVAKKSVLEIEREVAARWMNAVNKKKTGVC